MTSQAAPPLDQAQIQKASTALLKHLKQTSKSNDEKRGKRDLLAEGDGDDDAAADAEAIWLIFTTKKHIVPQKRLKPCKICLPHSLNTSTNLSICLITPEPQRTFKDVIASPAFPQQLGKRIERVIDIKKLEKKYHSFESKRALLESHDLFYADDRIITYLAKILGKTFYAHTTKRPIPVHLEAYKPKADKLKAALPSTKAKKEDKVEQRSVGTPANVAKEIEKTLGMTLVHLSPSVTTSVRVGLSTHSAEQLSANIDAVVQQVVGKFISREWKGLKSMHIKGPNTMALPIWLADELWEGDDMVVADASESTDMAKVNGSLSQSGKKSQVNEMQAPDKPEKSSEALTAEQTKQQRKRDRKRKAEEEGFNADMKERRQKLREAKMHHRATLKVSA